MMTLCEMTTCKTTFLAIMKHDNDRQKKHIDMHKHIFSIFAATVAFDSGTAKTYWSTRISFIESKQAFNKYLIIN